MVAFRYQLNKILEQERERLFLWLPVIFAFGILLYFVLKFEPSLWISAVVIESMIVLAYWWRRYPNRLFFLAGFAVFILGFTNIQLRAYHLNNIPLLAKEETLYLKGYVEAAGYNYRGKRYLILNHIQDFDGKSIAGKYRITPLQKTNKIAVGDCIETVAEMRPLMMPNMIDSYQFNRQQYFQGLKATGFSDVSVQPIKCSDIGVKPDLFLPFFEKIRQHIVKKINEVLPPSTAGVAGAIIAGERGKITPQQTAEYRDAGLAHFLAISGLHMGMIAGLMFVFVRWILACFPSVALRYDTKKCAAILAILMSFIYLIISGWQISTQRAFIMTAFVLLGVLFGRKAISMRMAAWAALVILILEPQVIISAGFQMSFAAVIMLIAFYEKYAGKFSVHHAQEKKNHFFIRLIKVIFIYLTGIVVADFVASLATLPFVIYHFNRISVYTSLANLLAGPVIALWIMPAVLFSLLLMPFGLDKYALYIAGKGIDIVNSIAHYVAGIDGASFQILAMPSWGLMLIVFGGLWLAIWQTKWRYWGWLGIVIGFLSVLTVRVPDILVDAGAKTFAVKTEQGKMLILPNRGNYFTKQMWSEKLALKILSAEEKHKLHQIYQGRLIDKKWLDLQCDKEKCIYQDKAVFYKKGVFILNDIDYTPQGALSVFNISSRPQIYSVEKSVGKRYWSSLIK